MKQCKICKKLEFVEKNQYQCKECGKIHSYNGDFITLDMDLDKFLKKLPENEQKEFIGNIYSLHPKIKVPCPKCKELLEVTIDIGWNDIKIIKREKGSKK